MGASRTRQSFALTRRLGAPRAARAPTPWRRWGMVNGDGYVDLLVATNWRSTAVVLLDPKAKGRVRGVVAGRGTWYAGGKFVPDTPSVAALGDVDGDGVPDVAINDPYYKGNTGAVHLLLIAKDGSLKREVTLTPGSGGLPKSYVTPKSWAGLMAFGGVSPGTRKTVAVGTIGSNKLTYLYLGRNATVDRFREAVAPQPLTNLDSLALEEGAFASSLTTAGASGKVLKIFSFLF
eukprot:TRINITY_DN1088_c0_g1_i2.p3 TRINITY_DN1088_c0_g1~~TRINITY_DN1088_c0_g1_i2.p3  ORF type:complete len:234 (-),score=69.71 TRINITY_DN1088_c0_g1_i2:358-1059(-)